MLGSIDPIIIFQIYKLIPSTDPTLADIPITSRKKERTTFAIIPIYLSEEITGLYIDTESKSIEIDTDTQSLASGEGAIVNQKALGSITTVNLVGKQGSIGLTILLALTELILDKVTSQEYEVTYMHGGVTVFGGLIHNFTYDQGRENDLYKIKFDISKGRPKSKSVVVNGSTSNPTIASQGAVPQPGAATAPAATTGTSKIAPISTGGLR